MENPNRDESGHKYGPPADEAGYEAGMPADDGAGYRDERARSKPRLTRRGYIVIGSAIGGVLTFAYNGYSADS